MDIAIEARDNGRVDLQSSPLTIETTLSLPDMSPRIIFLKEEIVLNLPVLKVSMKEENGNNVSVTVRLYGPNTDYVINQERELQELASHLNSPVVFAHNDLLSGNIMVNDEQEKLYFIDFEYGSYNYRGFDIGNHFNEYAGYDCDYSLYPNKEEQYHFFRHYLLPDKPDEVSDKDLEALYVETNTFMLASHIFWALWALIQAKMSPIDFDYPGYFFLRYNEYKKQKEMYISLAQSYLSKSGTG